MLPLKQALTNIICDWEYQNELCEKVSPLTGEYALIYERLTGLRQALDQLRMAGLVSYNGGKWDVAEPFNLSDVR